VEGFDTSDGGDSVLTSDSNQVDFVVDFSRALLDTTCSNDSTASNINSAVN